MSFDDLTLLDRCDACSAQAFAQASVNGVTLLFCGHHFRKHGPALIMAGHPVHDDTHKINESPSVSANADA